MFKKANKQTNKQKTKQKGLINSWWEYKLGQPLWKLVWKFLKSLKAEAPHYSVMPVLCV